MTALPEAFAALTTPDANLGLQPGEVQVRSHDPRWAELYNQAAGPLSAAVSDLGAVVEHIGSTSVPGLDAKPILDIAIGAPAPIDNEAYISRLEAIGCSFEADLGMYGGLLFSISTETDWVVSHIHVVDIADFQWRWYLGFRNALRSDPKLRDDYQKLKQQAALEHAANRDGYTQAKFDWVLETVQAIDNDGPA